MTVVVAHLTNTLVNVLVGLLVARWLGPVEFGRFALVLAASLVLQTLLFDWLRLAAARYTSPRSRAEAPDLHAGLEASFLALGATVLVSGAAGWALLPADMGRLAGLACLGAVINGLFDFRAGLARACFADRLYARLLVTKNAFAVLGTAGFSFWFGTAEAALVGVALSMAGSLLLVRGGLGVHWRDLGQNPGRGSARASPMPCPSSARRRFTSPSPSSTARWRRASTASAKRASSRSPGTSARAS